MSYQWPEGIQSAAMLSFDVDGESGMLQADPRNAERLSVMSWAKYGPKVGVPRILDMLAAKGVKATFFVPGYTAELYPELIQRINEEGHEVGSHGYLHEPVSQLDPIAEEATLAKTSLILQTITGQKPVGYRAPWWELNPGSPALLAQHGYLYDSSLMDDDCPYTLATAAGDLVELPVHWTNDDWEQFAFLAQPATGSGVIETCAKALQLWKEEVDGAHRYGGLFVLTMHPEIIGRAARVMMLEALIDYIQSQPGMWLTTGKEIAQYQQAIHQQAETAAMSRVG